MNTLGEKDIDDFFNVQLLKNTDALNKVLYITLALFPDLMIRAVYYYKLLDQYVIVPRSKHSIFTIARNHPFYDIIHGHVVEYKLSDRDQPDFVGVG